MTPSPDTADAGPAADPIEAHVAAAARLLGLTVPDAARPGVLQNFAATAAAARLVLDFPLDDVEDEHASVFEP